MLVLVVAIMSACGSSGDGANTSSNNEGSTASTDNGQPKDGGSIIIAVQDDPKVMNPIYAGDRVTLTIDQSLYAPLFNVNDGKNICARRKRQLLGRSPDVYIEA